MGNGKSKIDAGGGPKWYEIEEAMHEANLAKRYAMQSPKFRSSNRPPPLKSVVLFKEFTPDNDKQTTSEASTIIEVALLKINERTAGDGVEPDISFKVDGNRKEIHISGSIADVNELRRVANGLRWVQEKKTQFNRTVSNSVNSKPPKPRKPSKRIGPRRRLIWGGFGSVPVYRPGDALEERAKSELDAELAGVEARLNAVAATGLYQGAPPSSIEPSAVPFFPYRSEITSRREFNEQIKQILEAISKDPNNPDNFEQLAALSKGIETYYKNANGTNMLQDDLIRHASSLRAAASAAAAGGAGKAGGARRTKKRRGYKKRPGNRNGSGSRSRNQKLTIS